MPTKDVENGQRAVSRRQLLKTAGAVGAAAAGAATLGWSYSAGASPFNRPGWESRQGVTYFNRKPFEVDKPRSYEIVGTVERFDPRYDDRSRPGLLPDEWPDEGVAALSPDLQEFYAKNPILLEWDKDTKWGAGVERAEFISETLEANRAYGENEAYLANVRADAYSRFPFSSPKDPPEISDWEGVSDKRAEFYSPEAAAQFIKRLASDFGAVLCRITDANPAWIYKCQTRDSRGFVGGETIEIRPWWKYAIVITQTMNPDTLASDPNFGTSYDGYTVTSFIAELMSNALRRLGYASRVNSPRAGYDLLAVPFAVDAGFGEFTRAGFCVSPDFGGNFRQAVVLTDLPLATDKPIDAGIAQFCKSCKLCASICPTGAIPIGDAMEIRGVLRWNVDGKKCADGWDEVSGPRGCRVCIAACPFFKKNSWVHNLVRDVVTRDRTGATHKLAAWVERNVYGRPDPSTFVGPNWQGYRDPPAWLRTADYVKQLVPTPKGGA